MIPNNNDNLQNDFEIEIQPTKTYFLNTENNTITGYCEGLNAIKQAVYKILNTERYDYLIYSWNYGVEIKNLIGEPSTYVIPELERVIKEALLQDDRIIGVNNFIFTKKEKNMSVTFNVETLEGEISIEKVVSL